MKFAYLPLTVRKPSPTMGSVQTRYRPIVPIHILAPRMSPPLDACIDCAAVDTVLPPHLATRLGISLSNAPSGKALLIGGTVVAVHYAQVTLLLSDGYETCEWDAVVAFSTVPMRWALLGHAGFLEFFDVHLYGAKREVVIDPNTSFAGQHFSRASPLP